MRLKPGQKLVCTADGKWKSPQKPGLTQRLIYGKHEIKGPKYNEIVTIEYLTTYAIALVEYPEMYAGEREIWDPRFFQPLVDDLVLEKELEMIFHPTKWSNSTTLNPSNSGELKSL